jgi:predicted GH43/DUF377 family glycosyl hydrolase
MRESKSASALWRDPAAEQPHQLMWGDGPINLALSNGTASGGWTTVTPGWIPMRSGAFDSALTEGGPPPLPLRTGDHLYVYNSAAHGFPSPKPQWDLGYHTGFAILSAADPTVIQQRSDQPILSPELYWETGNATDPTSPAFSLTPNVVFVEGLIPLPAGWEAVGPPAGSGPSGSTTESFLFVYGAADSHVGVGRVDVTY